MGANVESLIVRGGDAARVRAGSLAALCMALAACAGVQEAPAYPLQDAVAPTHRVAQPALPAVAAALAPARVIIQAPPPASQVAAAPASQTEANTQAPPAHATAELAAFTPKDSPLLAAYPRGPHGSAPPVEPPLSGEYRRPSTWSGSTSWSFRTCGYYACGAYYPPGLYSYGYGYRHPGYYGYGYPGYYAYGYASPIVLGAGYGRRGFGYGFGAYHHAHRASVRVHHHHGHRR